VTAFPIRHTNPTSARKRMRELVAAPEVAVFPGPYDATSAIIIQRAGFEGLWAGGYVGSATQLGVGDLALTTMVEQLRFAASLVDSTGLPVIADCDDGYGGILQVARTMQAFERAGVAGMVFEDQAAPKHCAFYAEFPLILIDKEDMVAKLKTALDARVDETTMIWARSDALAAGMGVDATLERIHAYADAGVDAIFVPSTKIEDLAAYAKKWDRPTPLVISATAFVDFLDNEKVRQMGFSIRTDAFAAILAALQAVEEVMVDYRKTGTLANASKRSKTFKQFEDLLDTGLAAEMDVRYSNKAAAKEKVSAPR
jgi:2-methylisocitrate lyase-like PEP mutase family enzyme